MAFSAEKPVEKIAVDLAQCCLSAGQCYCVRQEVQRSHPAGWVVAEIDRENRALHSRPTKQLRGSGHVPAGGNENDPLPVILPHQVSHGLRFISGVADFAGD